MKVIALITLLTIALTQTLSAQNFDSALSANKRGDYKTAIRHLRPLAEMGYPDAQALLGAMYAHGRGVPADPIEAIKWFRKGIAQDNHWAQHNLGYMYSQGHGVQQNYFKAAKWFRKAANQGNADSQSNLGAMYLMGVGVPQDFQLSYIWLSVADANGSKFALENLNIVIMKLSKDQIKKAETLINRCQKKPKQCP